MYRSESRCASDGAKFSSNKAASTPRLDSQQSRRFVAREPTFPVGRKRQRGANVLALQVGEVRQNFILRRSASHVVEDIVHENAQPAEARLTAALPRLDGYSLAMVRKRSLLSLHSRRQTFS